MITLLYSIWLKYYVLMIYISNDGSNYVFIFFRCMVFTKAFTQNLNLHLSLNLINFTTAISIHL